MAPAGSTFPADLHFLRCVTPRRVPFIRTEMPSYGAVKVCLLMLAFRHKPCSFSSFTPLVPAKREAPEDIWSCQHQRSLASQFVLGLRLSCIFGKELYTSTA